MGKTNQQLPNAEAVPRHIAIIMDGNGRWAKKRFLPRVAGHKRGLEAVRQVVKACSELGVKHLTLFAFSTENWHRPEKEVSFLMELFLKALENEVQKLHSNNIRLRIVGSKERFNERLRAYIQKAEDRTVNNTGLNLNIAADYGGRWDIVQAVNQLIKEGHTSITEQDIGSRLVLGDIPDPDLFIRTGGEERISNFLLWQIAYSELFFTDKLWPDFDRAALDEAIVSYRLRERRFGRTSEQVADLKE